MGQILFMAILVATADASTTEALRNTHQAIIDNSIGKLTDTSDAGTTQRRAKLFDMFRQGEKRRSELVASQIWSLEQWQKNRRQLPAHLRGQARNLRASLEKQRQQQKNHLARLVAARGYFLPWFHHLEVGQVGILQPQYIPKEEKQSYSWYIDVIQIINDQEMIVERREPQETGFRPHETTLWLKGFSTTTLTDKSFFHPEQIYQVTGTKRYTTVIGGSNTILLIEPFRFTREDLKAVQKALAPQPKPAGRTYHVPVDKAKLAANMLSLGKGFHAQGNEEAAKKWFHKVIDRYPDTEAAKEARVLLGE